MSNESTSRLSRLTAILTRLQAQRLTTSTELSHHFDVSVRTIYRDIRALEAAGIPIVTEEGLGYTLMEGYRLPPVMFTESEANALITAEKIIAENNDASLVNHYTSAVLKIKSVLRGTDKDKANLLEQRMAVRKNWRGTTSHHLATLQQAITHCRVVKLDYTSLGKLETTTRLVEPLALYSTQDNWILIAWCRLRDDERAFRLDQINKLLVLDEIFDSGDFDLPTFFKSYIP